ncbi:hypothetical protein [Pseudomonas paraeruginosa]|uniref:hypothetical protein n=1 Tax=Pseudomonas paraeruginosa TaxID=2994495 RepID=UPI0039FD5E57
MSRTNTKTYELRHPETGHAVYVDFGSRSFSHFLSLGYSYPDAEPAPTEAPEAKPAKKTRAKPKTEAAHGDDNP